MIGSTLFAQINSATTVKIVPKNQLIKKPLTFYPNCTTGVKIMIQLDFFEKDQLVLILEEIKKIRESSEKVRRGVYSRVAELEIKLKEMQMVKQKAG